MARSGSDRLARTAGVTRFAAVSSLGADRQSRVFYSRVKGEAEDAGEILSLGEQAQVPFGHFKDVLLIKDLTPLHPRVLEYKLYAEGVGPVLVLGVSGGSDREELLGFEPPPA